VLFFWLDMDLLWAGPSRLTPRSGTWATESSGREAGGRDVKEVKAHAHTGATRILLLVGGVLYNGE
jgi:hypothetical protein